MFVLKIILWAAAIWCAFGFITIALRLSEKIWIPRGEVLVTIFVACVLGPVPFLEETGLLMALDVMLHKRNVKRWEREGALRRAREERRE